LAKEVAHLVRTGQFGAVASKVFEECIVPFETRSVRLPKPSQAKLWNPGATGCSECNGTEDTVDYCVYGHDNEAVDRVFHRLKCEFQNLVREDSENVTTRTALLGSWKEVYPRRFKSKNDVANASAKPARETLVDQPNSISYINCQRLDAIHDGRTQVGWADRIAQCAIRRHWHASVTRRSCKSFAFCLAIDCVSTRYVLLNNSVYHSSLDQRAWPIKAFA
jgi:hypothetical protein